MILLIVAALVATIFLAMMLTRSIVRPLGEAAAVAQVVASAT